MLNIYIQPELQYKNDILKKLKQIPHNYHTLLVNYIILFVMYLCRFLKKKKNQK